MKSIRYLEYIIPILFNEACEELKAIGISTDDVPMTIGINYRSKKRFGACKHNIKEDMFYLEISSFILTPKILSLHRNEVKATIIHEILHAVADFSTKSRNNHGRQWASLARLVNTKYPRYKISRLSTMKSFGLEDIEKDQFKYILRCSSCSREWKRSRISNLVKTPERYRCGKCNGKIIRIK